MSKVINIEGRKSIKQLAPEQLPTERKESGKWTFPEEYLTFKKQNELIQKLYMNIDFTEKKALIAMIQKKINSYKQQDIEKQIYSNYHIISLEDTIQKLVESKMKCKYCQKNMLLIYKQIREPLQWTLDRIDNDYGHNTDNVLISCLECNLKRRNTNMEKFLFTKQLKINKVS